MTQSPLKTTLLYVGQMDGESGTLAAAFLRDGEERVMSLFSAKLVKKGLGYNPVIGWLYEAECADSKTIKPSTLRVVSMHPDEAMIAEWRLDDEVRHAQRLAARRSKLDADMGAMKLRDIRDAYQTTVNREHVLAKLVAYLHKKA